MAIGQKVKHTAIMRITGTLRERLESLIFSRYPDKEWATYFPAYAVEVCRQAPIVPVNYDQNFYQEHR